jgi:hypothetical protein
MPRFVTLSVGRTSLTIPANPQQLYAAPMRMNHIAVDTAAGGRIVVDLGPTKVEATIEWKGVHYDVMKEYESFVLDTIRLGALIFDIECPDYFDLGLGMGVSVADVRYNGDEMVSKLISARPGDSQWFDIKLPYSFIRG